MHYTNYRNIEELRKRKGKSTKAPIRFEVEWKNELLIVRLVFEGELLILDKFREEIHFQRSFIGRRAWVSDEVEFEIVKDDEFSNSAIFHYNGKPIGFALAKLKRAYYDEKSGLIRHK